MVSFPIEHGGSFHSFLYVFCMFTRGYFILYILLLLHSECCFVLKKLHEVVLFKPPFFVSRMYSDWIYTHAPLLWCVLWFWILYNRIIYYNIYHNCIYIYNYIFDWCMHVSMLHSFVGVSVMCSYDICMCFIQIVDVMPHFVALSASLWKTWDVMSKIIKTKIGISFVCH